MEEDAQLKLSAFEWILSTASWEEIKDKITRTFGKGSQQRLLHIKIGVNYGDISEFDETLGTLLLHNPLQFQKTLQSVLYTAAVTFVSKMGLQGYSELTKSDFSLDDLFSVEMPNQKEIITTIINAVTPRKRLQDQLVPVLSFPDSDLESSGSLYYLESPLSKMPEKETPFSCELNQTLSSQSSDYGAMHQIRNVTSLSQVLITLRVSGVPWGIGWSIGSVRDIPLKLENPILSVVSGQIMAVSLPQPYTCCSLPLEENPSVREIGEKVTVLLLPDLLVKHSSFMEFKRQQSLRIVLRDELFRNIEPGDRVEITVMVCPKDSTELPHLEGLFTKALPPVKPSLRLPPILQELVDDRRSSPWSLVWTLGYMFASNISPPGTFHRLKIALLLSLVSSATDKTGLSVLAVHPNTSILVELFRCAASLASHWIMYSSLDSLAPTYSKHPSGLTFIEAGSLQRASGGVCILGDISRFKTVHRKLVCQILDNKYMTVESFPQICRPGNLSYPLKATIWACYDPRCKLEGHASSSDDLFQISISCLNKSVTDVFGVTVYCETADQNAENEAEDALILQTLAQSSSTTESVESLLPNDQLRDYIRLVKTLQTEFSQEAETLIQGYYIATRRLRGDCVQGSAVPVTTIQTLIDLASSHARLSLRQLVEDWDAVAAIMLCEEAIAANYGISLLNVKPKSHLQRESNLSHILGKENDDYMLTLLEELKKYIYIHTGDVSH